MHVNFRESMMLGERRSAKDTRAMLERVGTAARGATVTDRN
jgi:hypothetical protein